MAKIILDAAVPNEMLQALLQNVRDFDLSHEGCHFSISIEAPDISAETMQAIFHAIRPPFETLEVYPAGKATA
jgi:hypothetical protein